jgi:hypothetical protein
MAEANSVLLPGIQRYVNSKMEPQPWSLDNIKIGTDPAGTRSVATEMEAAVAVARRSPLAPSPTSSTNSGIRPSGQTTDNLQVPAHNSVLLPAGLPCILLLQWKRLRLLVPPKLNSRSQSPAFQSTWMTRTTKLHATTTMPRLISPSGEGTTMSTSCYERFRQMGAGWSRVDLRCRGRDNMPRGRAGGVSRELLLFVSCALWS